MPDSSRMYPLWLRIEGQWCVVVGGGVVAARKAAVLLDCGARVRVVSPEFVPDLLERGDVQRIAEVFRPEHLDGAVLAIVATDDPGVNEEVVREARRRGVLVNVVDRPALCDFIVPATVTRGPITWGVSTHGTSPALARRLRQELEHRYDAAYGELARLLGEVRPIVQRRFTDPARRRQVFDALSTPDWLARVRDDVDAAGRDMRRWIETQQ